MTKEQAMIEANFNLYVGYLKLETEKKRCFEILKDAGMSSKKIEEFVERRLEEIKKTIAHDPF